MPRPRFSRAAEAPGLVDLGAAGHLGGDLAKLLEDVGGQDEVVPGVARLDALGQVVEALAGQLAAGLPEVVRGRLRGRRARGGRRGRGPMPRPGRWWGPSGRTAGRCSGSRRRARRPRRCRGRPGGSAARASAGRPCRGAARRRGGRRAPSATARGCRRRPARRAARRPRRGPPGAADRPRRRCGWRPGRWRGGRAGRRARSGAAARCARDRTAGGRPDRAPAGGGRAPRRRPRRPMPSPPAGPTRLRSGRRPCPILAPAWAARPCAISASCSVSTPTLTGCRSWASRSSRRLTPSR